MHLGNMKSRIILFFFLVVFLFNSCNVGKNRKILSIFFDGVPPPKKITQFTTEELKNQKDPIQVKSKAIFSVHPDYKERKCENCHNLCDQSDLSTGVFYADRIEIGNINDLCFCIKWLRDLVRYYKQDDAGRQSPRRCNL